MLHVKRKMDFISFKYPGSKELQDLIHEAKANRYYSNPVHNNFKTYLHSVLCRGSLGGCKAILNHLSWPVRIWQREHVDVICQGPENETCLTCLT